MQLSRMKIRTRLTIAFGVLVALMVGMLGVSLGAQRLADERLKFLVTQSHQRNSTAARLLNAANARAIAARNLVLVEAAGDVASERAAAVRAHETVQATLAELVNRVSRAPSADPEEARLVNALQGIEQRYGQVALHIMALVSQGQHAEAIRHMNEVCRPLLAALVQSAQQYASWSAAQEQALVERSEAAATQAMAWSLALGAAGLVVSGLFAWIITRSITQPIGEAVRIAQQVADGDLNVSIHAEGRDETSELLRSLARMQQGLLDIVRRVSQSSTSIAAGSVEIATGSTHLSHRTEEQAANLQQTAASMEELTSIVRQNAGNAEAAAALAANVSVAAGQGRSLVDAVVKTMGEIQDSARKVNDIIGVVDSIAFQTNILALNAAVESARAGEQGRGFAVVAGEVRTLAQRSAEAAREIKVLIANSAEKVDSGMALAGQTGGTIGELVQQVQQVSDLVGHITLASQEQSRGIEQIGLAVSQLDIVTQQNAALVEESAAAADSMSQQALRLAETVEVFRIG